ncbi:MAG: hypothetical protein ACP6IP_05210 [Candidatus Njordarchaeia archaeon]
MSEECKELLSITKSWLESGFFESAYEKALEAIECAKEKGEGQETICDEIEQMYRRQSDVYTEQRDWYSCGQVLFDAGRLFIMCEKFRKAADFLIEAAETFSKSAILQRQIATSYIYGAALLSKLGGPKKTVEEFYRLAVRRLEWETERYKLLRDAEQLAQTYDDFALVYLLRGDYERAIESLENAAINYAKLRKPVYYKLAAIRYSFIASIHKYILKKVGWSKFNRIAYQYFEKSEDSIAASIELLRINLYISEDESVVSDLIEAAKKIGESSLTASTILLLDLMAMHLQKDKTMDEGIYETVMEILGKSGDIKLYEMFRMIYVLKFLKPAQIDYLGKYKLTDGTWVRIW